MWPALCACQPKPALPAGVLAAVDGHAIAIVEFQSRFANATRLAPEALPSDPVAQVAVRQAFLEAMIDRALLEAEAKRLNVQVTRREVEDDIRGMYKGWPLESFKQTAGDAAFLFKQVQAALLARRVGERLLADVPASGGDELQAYFDAHPDEFKLPEQLHVRQIVCADRSQATIALTDLLTGGDFAEIAKKMSLAPEAARGGDLGFFARGELLPQIEEAALSLPVGEFSTLVESPFGVHILQVLERLPAKTLTFPEARPKIERTLRRQQASAAWRDARKRLREQAAVVIDWGRLPG